MTIAGEFKSWEVHLVLLHIVVDCLIEVLAHMSLEDDGKVISEPLALCASLYLVFEKEDEELITKSEKDIVLKNLGNKNLDHLFKKNSLNFRIHKQEN